MKHTTLLALALFTAGITAARAADDPIEAVRGALKADRQAIVAEAMQFSDAEATTFWPAYHQYRTQVDHLGDGIKNLVTEYAQFYPDVPADRARKLLKDLMSLEKEQAATRASFLRKLGKILPPSKALRFAQVESRLDLAVRAQLAAAVPLVPIEGQIEGTETDAVLYQHGTAGGVAVRTRRLSARVAAIDANTRRVTLLSPSGIKETVKVGPEAINFDQIRVGDRLVVVATEELLVTLAQPGDATDAGAALLVDLAPKGAKPGGVVASTTRLSGTISALDLARRTATLRFDDGSTRTLPVRSDVDLGRGKVGDRVVFQVTEMVAISVEKP